MLARQAEFAAAFAEFERDLIRERTLASLERAKAQGKILGRPYGAKDKKKRRVLGYRKAS
ncbi:MAG TPA: recombinase family protein [Nanoarchaeota archaeon]|nr:recombinase family protein [Nanoarchaeota archaeon]